MLSLWMLFLGLMTPAGQADISFTAADTGAPAVTSQLNAALWTQQLQIPSQSLQVHKPTGDGLRFDSFHTLNGVSLDWNREELLSVKGQPESIVKDEITGYTEYRYPGVTAALYDNKVYYVHVDNTRGGINVNGRYIPLNTNGIKQYFGTPDYRAEDGDVFDRNPNVIKVYKDETGRLTGVDLFNEAAT